LFCVILEPACQKWREIRALSNGRRCKRSRRKSPSLICNQPRPLSALHLLLRVRLGWRLPFFGSCKLMASVFWARQIVIQQHRLTCTACWCAGSPVFCLLQAGKQSDHSYHYPVKLKLLYFYITKCPSCSILSALLRFSQLLCKIAAL